MGFRCYLLYVFMVFVRPIEQFAPDLMAWRPILILWCVTFLASLAESARAGKPPVPRSFGLLAGLSLAVALSQLFNGGFGGLSWAVGDFSTPAMLFVLTALNVNTFARCQTVVRLFILCLTLLCVETLAAYHLGFRVEELVIPQMASEDVELPVDIAVIPAQDTSGAYVWRVRSVGFLRDPNDFAQTLVMMVPWLLMQVSATASRWRVLMSIGPFIGLFGYVLYLTHSRGGLVGLGAMGLFALRKRIGNVKTGLLAALALAAYQLKGSMGGRAMSTKEQSANERIEAWSEGLIMLKEHPLFGVGYGNFIEHHIRTAHNSYVLCFAELGLVGYFLWMGMIVIAFKAVTRVIESTQVSPELKRTAEFFRYSMIGFMVCAWFLSRAYIPTLFIMLAMAISLWACACKEVSIKQDAGLHTPILWRKTTLWAMGLTMAGVSMLVRISTM
ncbi:O-antigen ligase family protein [Aquabacterium sp.]|uniref:O-antigen ligase family protein n=1 Tax=Aquabacterium sp. TaxID=1872578 RepID=UPI0025C2F873|nr:O-antigen ligase family protein [Aquabacterium sp.]